MNGFQVMKTIEVCKHFILLKMFMWFLSNTYSFMKMKTRELCKVLNTVNVLTAFLSYRAHCYEKST